MDINSFKDCGYLSYDDPLYKYFQLHIAPQTGFDPKGACYRVFRLWGSHHVYLYEEKNGRFRVVGKFFKSSDRGNAKKIGETEFNNLIFLRSIGLSASPYYVVKPYGFNPEIDNVLVVEYINAESLSTIINDTIRQGNHDRLFSKLSALAHFLAAMHKKTVGEYTVNFNESYFYMGRLIQALIDRWKIKKEDSDELWFLREVWRNRSCMWEDRGVLVHGDATPPNFFFNHHSEVIAIDLERMKWADRVFDLGRLCGELKHFFWASKGNPFDSEPFIGHFLWEYCSHFPERENTFRAITMRIPFYMGINLLRIARNSWIDTHYRRCLINEAKQMLRANL